VQRCDGEVGAALSAVAAWLWAGSNLCCDYDARSGFRISQRLGKAAPPPQHPAVILGVPGSDHPILDAFRAAIERAERSILLVTMSAYRWNELPGFEAALIAALDRGVAVTLARRAPDERVTECPSIAAMRGRGMRVVDVPGLHAKGILIDDTWTAIFTGNLNPFSLAGAKPTDHVELAVVAASECGHLAQARRRLISIAAS